MTETKKEIAVKVEHVLCYYSLYSTFLHFGFRNYRI